MGPTPLLNTITLSEFTDLVQKTFNVQMQLITPVAKQLFIMDDLSANTGDTRRYDEVDVETYASLKREGQNAAKANVGTGYFKIGTIRRFAKEIDITWEMRRFNKYPEVTGQLTSLTHFIPQRQELNLTHIFTFGQSTSYVDMDGVTVDLTVGDGLAVFSAAHLLKYSATTWTNIVPNNPMIGPGGLEAAESLTVSSILSNFNERRVMTFNKLITSDDPNSVNTVKQMLKSTSDTTQPNPGVINVNLQKYTHVILPLLATTATGARDATKRRYWFLGSCGMGINGWQAFYGEAEAANLKTPGKGNNGEDFHNDNWSYGVRGAWLIQVVSGRGIIGSFPVAS